MKNILVLGGAGYIGSHCVRELVTLGYNVVVCDNLQTGHIESIADLIDSSTIEFYEGDIRDKKLLRVIFSCENIDAVIHFAANSLVGESMVNPLKYYDNNVYGTKVLLEVMNEFNIKKIVFSSTAAVYGNPKNVPITEDSETNPTNAYGETKLAMEKMFKWADIAYGIKYVSLRYFNACGASFDGIIGEAHNPETHLIPLVLKNALGQRESISVFGNDYDTKDGSCIRDYIHVLDLISAHIKALEYLMNGNESNIFNLGNNLGYSVFDIIDKTKEIVNKDFNVLIEERRAGDPAILVASNEKAKNILGWEPIYNLDDIISSALKWHKNHPNGFNK